MDDLVCGKGYILNDFMDDTTLKVTTDCIDRTWNQTINAQIMNDNLAGKMQTALVYSAWTCLEPISYPAYSSDRTRPPAKQEWCSQHLVLASNM